MNENFTEKINDIVFDTLARRCSVYIDGIGSLMLSSENVLTKVGGKVHSYPYYKVSLMKGERFGIDLKAHCLSISGIDKKNIDKVFSIWLDECGIKPSLSRFTISGVVAYDNGTVKMSDGLNKSLNPLYVEPEEGKRHVSQPRRRVNGAVIAVIAVLVVGVGAYFFLQGDDNYDLLPKEEAVKTETVAEEVVTEAPAVEEAAPQETVQNEPVQNEPISNAESFYLVVGVFSTKENALKYLGSIDNPKKNAVEVGGKFYATIGVFNTEDEAVEAKRKCPQTDCWVLNVKDNKPIYKEQ